MTNPTPSTSCDTDNHHNEAKMPAQPQPTTFTIEQYLAMERQSETKNEFHAGEVLAMTGASQHHNLITSYTLVALANAVSDTCDVYPSDMRVFIPAVERFVYPDISVVCGQADLLDDAFDTLLNPKVIIEVLSPTTSNYDRGDKFAAYRLLPSLQEYVLIAQDKPLVEHYYRQADESWVLRDVLGLANHVTLPSLQIDIALRDIYKKVTFDS